ncbi:MAG: PDZ domain-containing protein [Proteobacteria bacterium]|nr:PDZ domain-containing protein [Pseudomonadota bacterium]
MKKVYAVAAVSLAAGIVAAAIVLSATEPEPLRVANDIASTYFDQSAATDERIRALEVAVDEERQVRQLLEDELLVLIAEVERLSKASEAREASEDVQTIRLIDESRAAEFFRQSRGDRSDEERANALVEAGFTLARAEWILQRESELRVKSMQARFDAQRTGDMQAMFAAGNLAESTLREELGDAQYVQYLEANNRPTAVDVGLVLPSSAGHRAGLQSGDQIVSYDGQRVFSYSDLNNQTFSGEPGQSVVVDILRDGMPMQIVMPRGPIGVESRRFVRR